MKRILFFLALLAIPFVTQAQEQYDVRLSTTNVNADTLDATIKFRMNKVDAAYYNKRFGTDELERGLQQEVNKVSNRIADERERDLERAKRFLTPTEKQRILEAEEFYRDTIGTFERSQSQGSLVIKKSEPIAANIGKMYNPSFKEVYNNVWEGKLNTGGPSFEGIFTDLFIPYGLILTVLIVLIVVAATS